MYVWGKNIIKEKLKEFELMVGTCYSILKSTNCKDPNYEQRNESKSHEQYFSEIKKCFHGLK